MKFIDYMNGATTKTLTDWAVLVRRSNSLDHYAQYILGGEGDTDGVIRTTAVVAVDRFDDDIFVTTYTGSVYRLVGPPVFGGPPVAPSELRVH